MTDRTDRAAMRGPLTLKRPPAPADVAWNRAIRAPWVKLTDEERAAGWPDAFTPENLARLQYPHEGTDPEKKRARRDQAALLDALRASIEAGTLPTVECIRTVTKWREVPVTRDEFMGGDRAVSVDADYWKSIGGRVRKMEDGTEDENFRVIERAAFRDFLASQGIEPSDHIRAWLRPLELAEAHQGEAAASAKPKRETQAGRVEGALKECERRAADAGEGFDRSDMPGTKAEFLDLLHALDAGLRSIKTVDSLDRYLNATGCKWPLSAGKRASAAPLYSRLFPEAAIRLPGATSPQRRKA